MDRPHPGDGSADQNTKKQPATQHLPRTVDNHEPQAPGQGGRSQPLMKKMKQVKVL